MSRAALAAAALLLAACTALPSAGGTPVPTRTPDVQRAKLDIAYSAFVDTDVHGVSSEKALGGALDGARAAVKKLGVDADVPTPEFQDVTEPVVADFRKFADALIQLAARAPHLSPDELSLATIVGMIRTSPDCHTYYFDGLHAYDSRPTSQSGDAEPAPPEGRVIAAPDQAGLEARLLDGGVAYVRWRAFQLHGTYDIRAKVKDVLARALAAGARAWLFDLRGNPGGNGPEVIASYFLNGEPGMRVQLKSGPAGVRSAIPAFRLPAEYQLPIAVVQNDTSASGSEVFTLFLKENGRATVVGTKSAGCLGATSATAMSDGSQISVVAEEYVGAVTGSRYNNVGIPPDVPADDASAIAVAARLLRERIAQGR